jgi:hypothetical protein
MFVRIAEKKANNKVYRSLHIVQAYRAKGKPRQRIIANFGNIERFKERDIDNIVDGLCKAFGRPPLSGGAVPLGVDNITQALDYGHLHAILHLWKELKWTQAIMEEARAAGHEFDLVAHLKTMVANRLLDPTSKLALLDWLEGVYLPGVDRSGIEYHHLLRAMD